MNEAVFNLLMTVLTAVITAVSAYGIAFIKKKGEQAAAQTDSIKRQDAIEEMTDAISVAVSATSQTYVDALKAAGSFDAEAQKQALTMSLTACCQDLHRVDLRRPDGVSDWPHRGRGSRSEEGTARVHHCQAGGRSRDHHRRRQHRRCDCRGRRAERDCENFGEVTGKPYRSCSGRAFFIAIRRPTRF